MTQYYFRVYKRNKWFKSIKSIKSLNDFLKIKFFQIFLDENFFLKTVHK